MPPKKKVSSGEGSSSSASFDRRRFCSAEAAAHYAKLLEKNMHKERGMDQSHPNCRTLTLARLLNWGEFVKPPVDAAVSLVREFYANIKVKHDDYKVKIQGKMVAFDSKAINELYDIPDFEEDEYQKFMREPYLYEDIIEGLCEPGIVWKLNAKREPVTFPATSLIRGAYNWYHFVVARMFPSGHISDVNKSKAALVYYIMSEKTVDAGRVIQNSILKAAQGTSTVSMPHSSTITDLCHAAGLTWDSTEQMQPIKGDILLLERLPRDKRPRPAPSGPGEASGSASQPQPQAHVPRPRGRRDQTVSAKLDDLEQRMQEQWRITREHMDYMHDFTTVLAQRFPTTSASETPFPTPPSWSHQPVDDDA